MDWHASGITNSYEYEVLDRSMNHLGWLDGVTGGTISQSYRGDYRVTASLELDGQIPSMNGYVRIWNVASLGGETVRTCLATLMPEIPGMDYVLGRWTGSLDLYSGMKRLDTSLWTKDYGIAKNTAIAPTWSKYVADAGSKPLVSSGISTTKKTGAAMVLEFGTPVLSTCHALADALGGYIEVDPQGRICLVPYVQPKKMGSSWRLQSDADGMMLVGVAKDSPEVVNRVVARYETGARVYYAASTVAAAHPWSFANIGRWETRSMDVDAPGSGTGWLQKMADAELASLSDVGGRYEVRTLFDPAVKPGTVGTVAYTDSPDDGGLQFRAFCSQREIELDAAMTTTLTLEEIR